MQQQKLTIGIYGIQDCNNLVTPTISHDHGIAVLNGGEVVDLIELERFDRKKHSDQMPQYLYDLLKMKKLFGKPATYVFVNNILGNSFINSQGNIRFESQFTQNLQPNPVEGRMWMFNQFEQAYLVPHELAHLGACLPFYGNFKENSLLIHYDGGASVSNFSAWLFKNTKLENITCHWKLKNLTALFNANALTFAFVNAKSIEQNSVPGKFMGFASLGKYSQKIEEWLYKNHYFESIWKNKKPFFTALKAEFDEDLEFFDQNNKTIQDIAATLQHIFVRESFNEIKYLQEVTQTEYLYYSGGSALNILLNAKLVQSAIFKGVYIPPCCNDSGLALGAAAFYNWNQGFTIKKHSPYLNHWNGPVNEVIHETDTIRETAEFLLNGNVVGVCNGFGETGPRALGNRSILSLANSKWLAKKVSMEHKKREWYRPVAPIMLLKNTTYFTGIEQVSELSKYMLLEFKVLYDKQEEIEGVVHADGTARIQTLFSRGDNPFMFDLLTYLNDVHSVKALINTSFNQKGEPMVHTHEQALKSARAMCLDALILDGKLTVL